MKSKTSVHNFGRRLSALRKAKGLTQVDLATRIGTSRRVIAYYEGETKYPPTHLLIPIAKTLRISVDELLGLKKADITDSADAALWRRLKKAAILSKSDQKALLHLLDALIKKNQSK